ncbi:MAG: chorismate mutase [Kiritimatiellaeota bacterium]|nr:chorismate mutase [Kiritimatiellota bacterium]
MKEKTPKAIRGAVCSANIKEEITQRTVELYDRLLTANNLAETDILSIFFSITSDIDALNPAAALRQSGRAVEIAMMVFQEAAVQDSLPGTIRVLIHAFIPAENPVQHIYFRGAEKLRPDRSS